MIQVNHVPVKNAAENEDPFSEHGAFNHVARQQRG